MIAIPMMAWLTTGDEKELDEAKGTSYIVNNIQLQLDRTTQAHFSVKYILSCVCHIPGATYYGEQLGSLQNTNHGVAGDIYIVDSQRLHVVGFSYDGSGPGIFY